MALQLVGSEVAVIGRRGDGEDVGVGLVPAVARGAWPGVPPSPKSQFTTFSAISVLQLHLRVMRPRSVSIHAQSPSARPYFRAAAGCIRTSGKGSIRRRDLICRLLETK